MTMHMSEELDKYLKTISECVNLSGSGVATNIRELLARPSASSNTPPVRDMAGLVEALEKLARLGNGTEYGNSDGNRIAQEALSGYHTAPKPTYTSVPMYPWMEDGPEWKDIIMLHEEATKKYYEAKGCKAGDEKHKAFHKASKEYAQEWLRIYSPKPKDEGNNAFQSWLPYMWGDRIIDGMITVKIDEATICELSAQCAKLGQYLSRHPVNACKGESIEELAKSKGWEAREFGRMTSDLFIQNLRGPNGDKVVQGCTPECCKNKARQYLNGLEDKGGRK